MGMSLDVTITKAQIAPVGALRQCVNSEPVKFGGERYEPGSLLFHGFAGRINLDDRLYHGSFHFTDPFMDTNFPTEGTADFGLLEEITNNVNQSHNIENME